MVNPVIPRCPVNSLAAEAWAEVREPLDRQLSPLGLRAIEVLCPRPGETIIDVGCGAGQTVLQLADAVGPHGRVIGADIAPLLLGIARERTAALEHVSFVEGDAQKLTLPDQTVDAVFSRFGVMAFSDPVAAFTNFHRILKPTGRLAFVCWRSLEENELDHLPLHAAALEQLADAAPFSFAEPAQVRYILEQSGFKDIALVAHDQSVTCGDLDATISVLLKVGALGRILRQNPELSDTAAQRVRAALAVKCDPNGVALMAATWIVSARSSPSPRPRCP